MGYIKLTYHIKSTRVPVETIIQEIEYGSTFALYHDKEEIISYKSNLKWINWEQDGKKLFIHVDDSFFELDCFFEKFMTIFLYNFMDFGTLYLEEIDISNSSFSQRIPLRNQTIGLDGNKFLNGTIYKPYYHLSIEDKLKQTETFISFGMNVFKNDECFLISKESIVQEARIICDAIQDKAYYIPNVTSYVNDYNLIKELIDIGIKVFMVDFLVCGFKSVYQMKQLFPDILIWGHRIGYSTIEHYVSMQAIGVLGILAGLDFMHVGTPTSINLEEKKKTIKSLQDIHHGFMPVFTKTTPELLDLLIPTFQQSAIYLTCGYLRDSNANIIEQNIINWTKKFNYGKIHFCSRRVFSR